MALKCTHSLYEHIGEVFMVEETGCVGMYSVLSQKVDMEP
jgi:hypothetical protein